MGGRRGRGGCREVGTFSSSVFIFIKTKTGSRQCISNRDEKRRRKGLWESSSSFSRSRFLWEQELLCVAGAAPPPCTWPAPLSPALPLCGQLFCPLRPRRPPPHRAPGCVQQQHPLWEKPRGLSIWAEANPQAGERQAAGSQPAAHGPPRPAFCFWPHFLFPPLAGCDHCFFPLSMRSACIAHRFSIRSSCA